MFVTDFGIVAEKSNVCRCAGLGRKAEDARMHTQARFQPLREDLHALSSAHARWFTSAHFLRNFSLLLINAMLCLYGGCGMSGSNKGIECNPSKCESTPN